MLSKLRMFIGGRVLGILNPAKEMKDEGGSCLARNFERTPEEIAGLSNLHKQTEDTNVNFTVECKKESEIKELLEAMGKAQRKG